jgi:DNA primase
MLKNDILNYLNRYYLINKELKDYFCLQLTLNDVDWYINERKLNKDIIDLFQIGYCPDGESIYNFVLSRGWNIEDLQTIGFWKIQDDNILIKFENRLMFPFFGLNDNTIHGFSGRVLNNNKVIDKYVNTNNCILFNKSLLIYGLRESLKVNKTIDKWILVEGNIDVLSMFKAGYTTTVAAAGVSFTYEHIIRLGQFSKNFIILFDNDEAGKRASFRVSKILKDLHMNVKICNLIEVKDVDEAIRNDRIDIIKNAIGY